MDDGDSVRRIFRLDADDQSRSVLVYTPRESPRLDYVCEFIFGHVLGATWRITTNRAETGSHDDCSVNYSSEDVPGAYRIRPHTLLFESGIAARKPQPVFRDKRLYFFPQGEDISGLHFDLFAAVFYCISRMEEWSSFEPDEHGRFEAGASVLAANGYLMRPAVDEWIAEFAMEIRKLFPKAVFKKRGFKTVSTIDVDNLYAYHKKKPVRVAGGALKDLIRLDFSGLVERLLVVAGLRNDPFDIYNSVSALCRDKKIRLFYFFLMRTGTRYDRTIDPAGGAFGPVMDEIAGHTAGLHPSYESKGNELLLKEEIGRLEKITGKPITCSRQHYLRFSIKTTPQMLLRNGITTDFSMGFARTPGFRAGTSYPFYYYDVEKEKKSGLLFVPFCAMDGSYTVYKKTDARTALVELLALATTIRETGGFFVSVFHERTFSDRLYRGYGTLYKKLHERLKTMERE